MFKRILYLGTVFAFAVASLAGMFFSQPASAASRYTILSDSAYLSKNSMSQRDIQRFLENKHSYLATYKDKGPNESKKELASYLIWHAAQIWHINPQVILATLQKEQSLITNQNPSSVALRSAMGYGCPDGEDCNKSYYGFANQVNMATYQFRYNYEALMGHNSFKDIDGVSHPVGTFACNQADGGNSPPFYNNALLPGNTVTFSHKPGMSGTHNKTITIANKATASFLCYTPHVGPYSYTGYSGSDNFIYFYQLWFGYSFSFEKLAGPSGALNKVSSSDLGKYSKVLIDGDKIFVFYYDAAHKSLRYSYWNGNKWKDYLLDGAGSARAHGSVSHDVGQYVTAIKWNGDIQVYYYDATTGNLRHAWYRGTTWRSENMDGSRGSLSRTTANVGRSVSVLLYKGNIQLYYYDSTHKSLRHAWWPGDGRWHFETMDGTTGSLAGSTHSVGSAISSLIYKGDQIQLYYYDATNGSLKHTWWPGDGRWHFETMDGTTGSLGGRTSNVGSAVSAILYKGNIQMYYYDKDAGSLRHAWWPGDGRWHFETMDGEPTPTSNSTLLGNYINAGSQVVAKANGDELFVFYYDDASNPYWSSGTPYDHTSAWRLAFWKNGMWNQTVIDGGGSGMSQYGSGLPVSGQLSAAVYGGNLQVYYRGGTGYLMHAWHK